VIASVDDEGPLPEGFCLRGGGGLGLHLIAGLLDQLRGTLDVIPAGRGKAFVVRLPA